MVDQYIGLDDICIFLIITTFFCLTDKCQNRTFILSALKIARSCAQIHRSSHSSLVYCKICYKRITEESRRCSVKDSLVYFVYFCKKLFFLYRFIFIMKNKLNFNKTFSFAKFSVALHMFSISSKLITAE